ncbi:glycosyl hydrolases family 31-domain-containing protein [Paraphysoderma sedebokerense]|nr:glycosyl hydrolases family 31-domain-containing protein [Paraphysoderma sedebokerense]
MKGFKSFSQSIVRSLNSLVLPATVPTPSLIPPKKPIYNLEIPDQAAQDEPILLQKPSLNGQLKLQNSCSRYSTPIHSLDINVKAHNEHTLHVKIGAPDRWEVPQQVLPRPTADTAISIDSALYTFHYHTSPFSFFVTRKSDDSVIFDTRGFDFVFEKQYIEISTRLDKHANIYGFGENASRLKRSSKQTITLWARDAAPEENENVYGHHPFYMELKNGKTHGVFLCSSNGMDIVLRDGKLTYKIIGGVLEFYFFMGPSPYEVIDQYTQLIGRPHMPPYWSLGFHQCRWGYKDLKQVEEVVEKYRKADIPLEVMWTDIDYMKEYALFTWDPDNFPLSEVKKFLQTLHTKHQKYVLIVDPGVKIDESDETFTSGIQSDIFIKDATGKNFVGTVWPGSVMFPDWFKSKTQDWWTKCIHKFLDGAEGNVDGLWIDMNECANFCDGYCPPTQTGYVPPKSAGHKRSQPPYRINNGGKRLNLESHTLPLDLCHGDDGNVLEYDCHSLYGHMMAQHTREALLKYRPKKRPFLLTRSTFAGSGKYAAHWTGDNLATWEQLSLSIPSLLMFQMFGIPFVGADIGGFQKTKGDKEELVKRWIQLGALYPFSRNHADRESPMQELYQWESVADSGRKMLNVRYSLLPYLYTQFHCAHKTGRPIWRPMFFDFPEDKATYSIDTQFLFGPSILAAPILSPNVTTHTTYFPSGTWYNFYTHRLEHSGSASHKSYPAPSDILPLFIRGGSIIVFQKPGYTTTESRENNINLTIALDESGEAKGDVYFDDGESLNVDQFSMIQYFVRDRVLFNQGVMDYEGLNEIELEEIKIIGTKNVEKVVMNGEVLGEDKWSVMDNVLSIKGLGKVMNKKFKIEF